MHQNDGVIQSTGPDLSRYFFAVNQAVDLIELALRNQNVVTGQELVNPLRAATMRRVLDVWIQNFGGEWVQSSPRRGDRPEEFLIGIDEGRDSCLINLEGLTAYLLDPGSGRADSEPVSPLSSRNAVQLTDDEILDLLRIGLS